MTKQELFAQIQEKASFLCIGLDPDLDKLPKHLLEHENPILEFNKQIIEATQDLCVAYKPNTAFYECYGLKGWEALIETCKAIPADILSIADAKRGDIGNTSARYAETFFNPAFSDMNFDAVTVAPYMGSDSVLPFLGFPEKWVILLALTSNAGHADFQKLKTDKGLLYEAVLAQAQQWGTAEQLMFVVGATRAEDFAKIRAQVPEHFLLVPGVGAQGGDLQAVCQHGLNEQCGLLINSARQIIYAGNGIYFAEQARAEALKLQKEMEVILKAHQLI